MGDIIASVPISKVGPAEIMHSINLKIVLGLALLALIANADPEPGYRRGYGHGRHGYSRPRHYGSRYGYGKYGYRILPYQQHYQKPHRLAPVPLAPPLPREPAPVPAPAPAPMRREPAPAPAPLPIERAPAPAPLPVAPVAPAMVDIRQEDMFVQQPAIVAVRQFEPTPVIEDQDILPLGEQRLQLLNPDVQQQPAAIDVVSLDNFPTSLQAFPAVPGQPIVSVA